MWPPCLSSCAIENLVGRLCTKEGANSCKNILLLHSQCFHKGPQMRTWFIEEPIYWKGPHFSLKASFPPIFSINDRSQDQKVCSFAIGCRNIEMSTRILLPLKVLKSSIKLVIILILISLERPHLPHWKVFDLKSWKQDFVMKALHHCSIDDRNEKCFPDQIASGCLPLPTTLFQKPGNMAFFFYIYDKFLREAYPY